jgi:hypothetical protein
VTDPLEPTLGAYERCKRASEEAIAFFSKHDPEEVVHDRDFVRVLLNHIELVSSHVELGLLNWRRRVSPLADFGRGYAALEHLERYLARSAPDRSAMEPTDLRDHVYDFFGITFSLINKPIALGGLQGERLEFKYLLYTKYIASLLQDQPVSGEVKARALKYLRNHDGVFDESTRTYLMLLGELRSDAPVDELVTRADGLWLRRAKERYFDELSARDGYGEFNDIFVDYTLGAILKKIGWQGESVHRWIW